MTPEKRRAYQKRWRAKNPERVKKYLERTKAWQKKNPERHRAAIKRHHDKHPEAAVQNTRRWQIRHPDKVSLMNRRRKAMRRALLHPQHDTRKEAELFRECQRLTKKTGVLHQLDHIIPMNAGGWHHHDNLQPLPAPIDVLKSDNPVWEGKGYKCWRDVPPHLWPADLQGIYAKLMV